MADICFDVDTALAEVAVNKVPIVDAATAATIKTDLAYNAAGMALFWHFVTPAGAHTVTAVTPTTAGVHDWAAQSTSGIYTLEIPASGGTINNDAEGFGWFTGFATGYLPWSSPVYCFRAAALNDALIEGGNLLDVNVTHVADTAQTAGDLAALVTTADAAIDANQADLTDIQSRLPAALVGGRIDATVDGTGMEAGAVAAILTTAGTESYRADGAAPTIMQALCELLAHAGESSISGTVKTIKQFDGTTSAATFTLNDATTPTAITRAT